MSYRYMSSEVYVQYIYFMIYESQKIPCRFFQLIKRVATLDMMGRMGQAEAKYAIRGSNNRVAGGQPLW